MRRISSCATFVSLLFVCCRLFWCMFVPVLTFIYPIVRTLSCSLLLFPFVLHSLHCAPLSYGPRLFPFAWCPLLPHIRIRCLILGAYVRRDVENQRASARSSIWHMGDRETTCSPTDRGWSCEGPCLVEARRSYAEFDPSAPRLRWIPCCKSKHVGLVSQYRDRIIMPVADVYFVCVFWYGASSLGCHHRALHFRGLCRSPL